MNELLEQYYSSLAAIHEYFGYAEDWKVIPINDDREMYWRIIGGDEGQVRYHETQEAVASDDEETGYYEDEIYTQRHLPQWVYRGEDFTMISCDPRVDGNYFLRIFDNKKEIKDAPETNR